MSWLKSLSSAEQVGLLFAILFGVLTLLSLSGFVLSLVAREDNEAAQQRVWRFRREMRLVWLGACLFWVAWVSGAVGATLLAGVFSFLALREFVTLLHTRRGDHRSLLLAFFLILPLQYILVGLRRFDVLTVLIPVYAFLAIPVVSALAGDPARFLERNAKIQWGIMVCVYGLSHAPALLLLDVPGYAGRGAFLLFFLTAVLAVGYAAQELAAQRLRRRPVARHISRSFSLRALWLGVMAAGATGALLFWITPFAPWQAAIAAALAAMSGAFGHFVMKALKRDAGVRFWGNRSSITGATGLLDRIAVLCFAAPVFFHAVRLYYGLHL